jgi:hypothetical protein
MATPLFLQLSSDDLALGSGEKIMLKQAERIIS